MTRKPLLVLCTLACTVLAGCPDDLPVIPQWDADWALPLPTQSIPLDWHQRRDQLPEIQRPPPCGCRGCRRRHHRSHHGGTAQGFGRDCCGD